MIYVILIMVVIMFLPWIIMAFEGVFGEDPYEH